MGVRKLAAACAAALACAWAGDAGATIYTFTFEGTVAAPTGPLGRYYNGIDGDGLFGPAGASLVGDNFTAAFKVDTANGFYSAGWQFLWVIGGAALGTPSPVISNELTINGRTHVFRGGFWDSATISFDGANGVIKPNSYSYSAAVAAYSGDHFFAEFSPSGDGGGLFGSADGGTTGQLIVDAGSFSPAFPVLPEPATWAMLVLGVGMVGLAARRRREATPVAA